MTCTLDVKVATTKLSCPAESVVDCDWVRVTTTMLWPVAPPVAVRVTTSSPPALVAVPPPCVTTTTTVSPSSPVVVEPAALVPVTGYVITWVTVAMPAAACEVPLPPAPIVVAGEAVVPPAAVDVAGEF